MIFAQSFGEYGGTSLAAEAVRGVESGTQWVRLSLTEDRPLWIAAGVCLVLALWLFRRG